MRIVAATAQSPRSAKLSLSTDPIRTGEEGAARAGRLIPKPGDCDTSPRAAARLHRRHSRESGDPRKRSDFGWMCRRLWIPCGNDVNGWRESRTKTDCVKAVALKDRGWIGLDHQDVVSAPTSRSRNAPMMEIGLPYFCGRLERGIGAMVLVMHATLTMRSRARTATPVHAILRPRRMRARLLFGVSRHARGAGSRRSRHA